MKASQILQFQETLATNLKRPWQTYRDGQLFYGQSKSGNKRLPLSTKQGNKNFYKGTRSSGIGKFDIFGKYTINYQKVRTFVVPAELDECLLKPLVSANCPTVKNTFSGYYGVTDGRYVFDQVKQFIETGNVDFKTTEDYKESFVPTEENFVTEEQLEAPVDAKVEKQ
ncbi:unnamed protein product [Ambrosiozyma monospora]|uniref:Unnamed protein product n=1 Tax=Ambrosiozyma monospora TaxID=43982 RepID=A0A9W6SX33_AMBMO|nr:unnamed protein product [Ambrosiozyma monospora]